MTKVNLTELDNKNWDKQIISNPDAGNIFQSAEFAAQKQLQGWTPRALTIDKLSILVLEKSVPLLGKLWYLPKGPGVTTSQDLISILPAIKDQAARCGVFVVKVEPEIELPEVNLTDLTKAGLVPARAIQPNASTVRLDISQTLDETLASLNQKGRHAIRRAERDGVTVQQVATTDENCQIMYKLLADTAEGSFSIRSYDYYRNFWQSFDQAGQGQLFFAYYDGQIVASAYALIFGNKSTYKDGASIREKVVYGASHYLQWEVIKWAKSQGSLVHDLCGTPPSDKISDKSHPHYGIGRFKTSFSKQVTDYIGVYDLPVKNMAYKIWNKIGERVTLRLHRQRHHENWY